MYRIKHTPDINFKIVPLLSQIKNSLIKLEELRAKKSECTYEINSTFLWEEIISVEDEKNRLFEQELLQLMKRKDHSFN